MSECGVRTAGEIYLEYLEETFAGKRCHCWIGHRGYRGDSKLEQMFWHMLLKTEKSWHGSTDQLVINRYRVDAIVDCGGKSVVIEMDGAAYHDAVKDRRRDDELLNMVDAIIRIPYAPLGYYRFSTMFVLGTWFPRLSVGQDMFTVTDDEFLRECEAMKVDGDISTDDWLNDIEHDYDVVRVGPASAVIRSPRGFFGDWNVRPITLQHGNGRPEIIDRIYEKSGCLRVNG